MSNQHGLKNSAKHAISISLRQSTMRVLETCISLVLLALPIACIQSQAQEVPRPTLVEFSGPGCKPCAEMEHIIASAKKKYNSVDFKTIDVSDANNIELVEKYGVRAVPSIVALDSNGDMVAFTEGVIDRSRVESMMKQIAHQ